MRARRSPTPEWTPDALARELRLLGTGRAWLARRDGGEGGWRSSHPELAGLAAWLEACPDEDGHEALFLQASAHVDTLFVVALHRLARGAGQGGLRRWRYATVADQLRDGLRLSRGMTRKTALAGLWWGGGKGLMARAPGEADEQDPRVRSALYREFGSFVSSLAGCYVTAEDAGTRPDDVASVFETTRFVTCVPEDCGGAGDPSPDTARGVAVGIETAVRVAGLGELAGKRVLVQGVGRVGASLVDRLVERGARIVAAEASAKRLGELNGRWDGAPVTLRHIRPDEGDVLCEPCEVLAPCALGGGLGPDNISKLQCRIVCGAANNPLTDEERDAAALQRRDIVYVPDYVVNRMGIVRCADEHRGRLVPDPAVERHLSPDAPDGIPQVVTRILEAARRESLPTTAVAAREASRLAEEPHPIHGERARAIVAALLEGGWHR